jgi:hypothetical protein
MHAGIASDIGAKSCGSWPVLREPSTIPTIASWYPADLSKAQGKGSPKKEIVRSSFASKTQASSRACLN